MVSWSLARPALSCRYTQEWRLISALFASPPFFFPLRTSALSLILLQPSALAFIFLDWHLCLPLPASLPLFSSSLGTQFGWDGEKKHQNQDSICSPSWTPEKGVGKGGDPPVPPNWGRMRLLGPELWPLLFSPVPRSGSLLGGVAGSSSAHTDNERTTNKKFCVLKKKKPLRSQTRKRTRNKGCWSQSWACFRLGWQGECVWVASWRSSSFCPWRSGMFRARRRDK